MKNKTVYITLLMIAIIGGIFYLYSISASNQSANIKSELDALIISGRNTNFFTDKTNEFCSSLGLDIDTNDSTDDLRCIQRPAGYVLIKKLDEEKSYYCVDTFGGYKTLKLEQYFEVPEYCDLELATTQILIEQNKLITEINKLVANNDISTESQQKFTDLVKIANNYVTYTLQINPFNDAVVQATTQFYQALNSAGLEGSAQLDVENKIRDAQEKFTNQ